MKLRILLLAVLGVAAFAAPRLPIPEYDPECIEEEVENYDNFEKAIAEPAIKVSVTDGNLIMDNPEDCSEDPVTVPDICALDQCQDGCDQDCDFCGHLPQCMDKCDLLPDHPDCLTPCQRDPCADGCAQSCNLCPSLPKCAPQPTDECVELFTDEVTEEVTEPTQAPTLPPTEAEDCEEEDAGDAAVPVIETEIEPAFVIPDTIFGEQDNEDIEDCIEEM